MFVRKKKIAHLIKKERYKERMICKKESDQQIKSLKSDLVNKYEVAIKDLKSGHKKISQEQASQIRKLKNEMEKNYNLYLNVRLREKKLYDLYHEVEAELTKMITKVHESMQPFYRTMSKIEFTKKKSDKDHKKYERALSLVR